MSDEHGVERETVWNCPLCEATFTKNLELIAHKKTIHKSELLYECPCCNKKLESDKKVMKHLKLKHPEVDRPFECSICKATFKWRQTLLE